MNMQCTARTPVPSVLDRKAHGGKSKWMLSANWPVHLSQGVREEEVIKDGTRPIWRVGRSLGTGLRYL